jgi:hypothetical protein
MRVMTMPRTTESGHRHFTLFKMFNRKIILRYEYKKFYREDIMTGKKSYWDGKSE